MLASAEITREYLVGKDIERQRVFLARSDPAMNYGLVSAVLLDKISLQRLYMLEEEVGIEIYPILGVGSAPFRGNFKPSTVTRVLEEYPAVHTFTIQSSFKYDNPPDIVRDAVEIISDSRKSPTGQVDEGRCLEIIHKYAEEYKNQVLGLAELINEVAKFVPGRRKRKLHIGLFGYARSLEGISLPRAIGFTAALYSIGIPPEILGLNALEERDIDFIRENYIHFDEDMKDSLRFLNPESLSLLPVNLRESLKSLGIDHDSDERHIAISSHILRSTTSKSFTRIEESVLQAANIRGFLG